MNSNIVAPQSPRTPGRQPNSPSRPPLHPGTSITPRSASLRIESPRSGSRVRSSSTALQGSTAINASSAGYRDALRQSLNNQSLGASSPSERSLRRASDRSPQSVTSSAGRRGQATDRVSLTRSMDKAMPVGSKKVVELESAVNILLMLGKSAFALLALLSGVVLGALLVTGSADWIFSPSTGESPLWSCPSSASEIGPVSALDGSSCEVRFSFSSYSSFEASVASAFEPYNSIGTGAMQCFQKAAYADCAHECQVRCFSSVACAVSVGTGSCSSNGFLWGSEYTSGAASDCMQTISLSGMNFQVTGASISAEPVCGTSMNLTPAMILTLRGELVSIFVVSILVFVGLLVRAKVAPPVRSNVVTQKGLMIAKASANELRSLVETVWDAEQVQAGTHPAKHFAASSWKYRVRVLHAMLGKRESLIFKKHLKDTCLSCLFLLGLCFAVTVLLLSVLPSSLPFNAIIKGTWEETSWTSSFFYPLGDGLWVYALSLADVAVEFAMVLMATIVGLRWQTISSEKELKRLSQIEATEEACLVILVSAGTCLKTRGRDKLIAAVESGLKNLRVGSVFVLDMGTGNAPLDDTWKIVSSIHPNLVHYAYLPDTNRQLGQNWLSQIWIPFLHKSGKIHRLFKQMLVLNLDSIAQGASLKDLTLGGLNRLLMVADGNIDDSSGTQVLLPVRSDLPDWTGKWESHRLACNYYSRMMQAALSGGLVLSVGDSSESVSIKDRRVIEDSDFNADPVQHALAATRRRGRIYFSTQSCVDAVVCQNTIYDAYCTFSKQIFNDLCLLKELVTLTPSALSHGSSIALKIFILTGPALDLFLLLLRPLVFGALLFRDPLSLILLIVTFYLVSTATGALHCFNQWRYRRTTTLSSTLFSYPVYLMYLGCVRLGLAVSGATFGRLADETLRPSVASCKELYPCLPHPQVDWFTCWKTSDASRLSVLTSAAPISRLRSHSSDCFV